MLTTFFQGFLLSAAMILPIGAQNAFVLQQGSKKQYLSSIQMEGE